MRVLNMFNFVIFNRSTLLSILNSNKIIVYIYIYIYILYTNV